jgi:8-oxo-dGTP pyrophosphatase MutT (NUDIX family)
MKEPTRRQLLKRVRWLYNNSHLIQPHLNHLSKIAMSHKACPTPGMCETEGCCGPCQQSHEADIVVHSSEGEAFHLKPDLNFQKTYAAEKPISEHPHFDTIKAMGGTTVGIETYLDAPNSRANSNRDGMQGFTLCFAFDKRRNKVLCIQKSKPAWQAGCLNGVGGKLREGEDIRDGNAREFMEETGIDLPATAFDFVGALNCPPNHWAVAQDGAMGGNGWKVRVFTTLLPLDVLDRIHGNVVEGEGVLRVINVQDHYVLPMVSSCHWLIPLCRDYWDQKLRNPVQGRPRFFNIEYAFNRE